MVLVGVFHHKGVPTTWVPVTGRTGQLTLSARAKDVEKCFEEAVGEGEGTVTRTVVVSVEGFEWNRRNKGQG